MLQKWQSWLRITLTRTGSCTLRRGLLRHYGSGLAFWYLVVWKRCIDVLCYMIIRMIGVESGLGRNEVLWLAS